MIYWLQILIIVVYSGLLLFIFLYSLIQANLVVNYLKWRNRITDDLKLEKDDEYPFVTVQLPIYNEKYVVERLIKAVAAFDYPKDRFEIQVMDDSNDETKSIIDGCIGLVKKQGINIDVLRRSDRTGFKAGALQYGLERCKGDFIAIFDADFVPKRDFLKSTVAYFSDPKIGVVQTKWEHINRDYSLLTKLQAFGLDAHFSVEQKGRNAGNHFINFNGTAGVWRKTCIVDAGGWQSDTLTEDLDLSYRAQLMGWKFKFLESVGAPAELPAVIDSLKTQQFRWTKGAAECTRKNLGKVWRDTTLPLITKVHALFHLMNSFLFICIFSTAVLSIPMLFIKSSNQAFSNLFTFGTIFLLSLVSLSAFYWTSNLNNHTTKMKATYYFAVNFPMFLSIYMGLSLHNTIAVAEGYLGRKTPFIRTPKFNIVDSSDSWKTNSYLITKMSWLTVMEGIMAVYFLYGIVLAFFLKDYGLLPFHLLLFFGFSAVFYYSFNQHRKVKSY